MSDPVQSLGVVPRLFPEIVAGRKTSTIRWREAAIVPGALTFVDDADRGEAVEVEVHRCAEMRLSDAAAYVGRADEWPDDVMLRGMREHYPGIELSSTVQVIEFNLSAAF